MLVLELVQLAGTNLTNNKKNGVDKKKHHHHLCQCNNCAPYNRVALLRAKPVWIDAGTDDLVVEDLTLVQLAEFVLVVMVGSH